MNYLITAAGKGSRFLQGGIKPPKPLIKVFDNELLIWSMNSFQFCSEDKVFIVTLFDHKVRERLENKIKNLFPLPKIYWLELKEIFNGQLLTAIKAITYFKIEGPLVIHNCDTSYSFNKIELNTFLKDSFNFGIIPCFKAPGNHWSFAKCSISDPSLATEVKEKKRISDNCSVGTYIFSSCKDLLNLSKDYFKKNLNKTEEYYIAPIFQYAIDNNLGVKIVNAEHVKVYGTPNELLSTFKISFEQLLGENGWNAHQTKTLIVDIDETICKKEDNRPYHEAIPIEKVINSLKKANSEGVYIILFTSRNMRTFRGSIGLINKFTAPTLIKWLDKYKIPYDEIYFGKPWGKSVSYIDDKSLSIENLIKNFSD